MKTNAFALLLIVVALTTNAQTMPSQTAPRVKTANGVVEGVAETGGINAYKGLPFAQPPVGDLRWKAPQAPKSWKGIRKADHFGPQAMQRPIFSDMVFRSDGRSEDCLYLNVWTPAQSGNHKLPVLVYFYGGGLIAGDGSEVRYDGESMAKKGMISVTVNYRLGIFGFLAHPELTAESAHHASGNYGLMDQHAALIWVQKNIAAFGGDPARVTIAGESAGSMSVCGQVASPLSKGLFAGAIAESGALLGNLSPVPLAEAERAGTQFAAKIGVTSLAQLRAMAADKLLELSANSRFPNTVDGYFLPESPQVIFAKGQQMQVPLLVGWNTAESNAQGIIGKAEPTLAAYQAGVATIYGDKAAGVLNVYHAATDADVAQVATDLASDRFIAYSTWKFADIHSKTSNKPVYRYLYARKRPSLTVSPMVPNHAFGAVHSAEIEYALGNLHYNKVYAWTAEDVKVSETMQSYFANFIKTGNPNGDGLPPWGNVQGDKPEVMLIDVNSVAQPSSREARYRLMDSFFN